MECSSFIIFSGQQLALWLLTDLLFSLFGGSLEILPDRFPVTHSVTHVLVPIYILQALNMRTCLNQLTMSSVTYFISQTNAGIRFSQD